MTKKSRKALEKELAAANVAGARLLARLKQPYEIRITPKMIEYLREGGSVSIPRMEPWDWSIQFKPGDVEHLPSTSMTTIKPVQSD